MTDDFKIKAAWGAPPDRFNVSVLTLDFSGRITREIDRGESNTSAEVMAGNVDLIISTARMTHDAVASQMIGVMRRGLPLMIGGGSPISPTPTFLLEMRVSELRKERDELREKLAERTTQRDELRRIFEPPTSLGGFKWGGKDGQIIVDG